MIYLYPCLYASFQYMNGRKMFEGLPSIFAIVKQLHEENIIDVAA